jgi:hypothetical protein
MRAATGAAGTQALVRGTHQLLPTSRARAAFCKMNVQHGHRGFGDITETELAELVVLSLSFSPVQCHQTGDSKNEVRPAPGELARARACVLFFRG